MGAVGVRAAEPGPIGSRRRRAGHEVYAVEHGAASAAEEHHAKTGRCVEGALREAHTLGVTNRHGHGAEGQERHHVADRERGLAGPEFVHAPGHFDADDPVGNHLGGGRVHRVAAADRKRLLLAVHHLEAAAGEPGGECRIAGIASIDLDVDRLPVPVDRRDRPLRERQRVVVDREVRDHHIPACCDLEHLVHRGLNDRAATSVDPEVVAALDPERPADAMPARRQLHHRPHSLAAGRPLRGHAICGCSDRRRKGVFERFAGLKKRSQRHRDTTGWRNLERHDSRAGDGRLRGPRREAGHENMKEAACDRTQDHARRGKKPVHVTGPGQPLPCPWAAPQAERTSDRQVDAGFHRGLTPSLPSRSRSLEQRENGKCDTSTVKGATEIARPRLRGEVCRPVQSLQRREFEDALVDMPGPSGPGPPASTTA